MRSLLVTALTVLLFSNNSSAQDDQDTIHWRKDYKLKKEDFKGEPDMQSAFAAVTRAEISLKPYYSTDTSLKFSVVCVFHCHISWINPYYIGKNIIEHEQGHFDIAEVFSRKLILELNFLEKVNYLKYGQRVDSLVKDIFNKLVKQRDAVDSEYDKACAFPPNQAAQIIWTQKIQYALLGLRKL